MGKLEELVVVVVVEEETKLGARRTAVGTEEEGRRGK